MSRNYCANGCPVTEQVLIYQKTRQSEDFVPVLCYYDDYKDVWYAQLEDYMDRMTFEAEFDYKLVRAVDTFDGVAAQEYSESKNLNSLGNFNRWFYKILMNWKSNVKTSCFRLKKRPGVMCPVCGKEVGRIDESHLQHYKTTKDLPRYFVWNKSIYETAVNPRVFAISWGSYTKKKMNELTTDKQAAKRYVYDRKRVRWPWRLKSGKRGVLCPFTHNIIESITDDYIRSLPAKHSRYAPSLTWADFAKNYPSALIQSEIFSLEHTINEKQDCLFKDKIGNKSESRFIDHKMVKQGVVTTEHEYAFAAIDRYATNKKDRNILKLIAIGYTMEDISSALHIDETDIKHRLKNIRDKGDQLKKFLLGDNQ